ncbi:hypothetical protein A3H16_03570 [Candidatus Kaiserbacteria bacterium RIFCSPLOWO2_12_FULL_53_8]|uniref:Uncharacterized protein n=2 Tax=Candidatus Kaiseribacteriota TaxID=1752734 RepID=A0A1F6CXD7_9BACT|nr:MAG: hypothetical protein A2851_01365 [Candidatus Kaiserbacteria bacterium RIFCSPHIGHO2_01_FULL_53_29]OGG91801.1 MAG: hypothetical protein A3H16_03570 [Candidatus Kaiserbacteria bacterium RIFCSPLOWO2_12_FULL_53_8]
MSWKAPTHHLKKKELLNDNEFYRKLSSHWDYVDSETATRFYLEFVKLVANELKEHKFCRLPFLGDMAIVEQKSRPAWVGKAHIWIGPRFVLKFYPKEKMRRHFNKKQGDPVVVLR